ncbi:hypothetical protein [Sodalis sp. RH19]|uniref:hypothetical protein n=1 Tax=Sodalis sp. RH19 TaxID=3394334 RepID=UPI0039B5E22C
MWYFSATNIRHDINNDYLDYAEEANQPLISEVNSISNSQISINASATNMPVHKPFFRRVMQRMADMLAYVGNYFHHGDQQWSFGATNSSHPKMGAIVPLLDEPSMARATLIINDLMVPLPSLGDKQQTVEEKVYFIGIAVIRLAESKAQNLIHGRAKKKACEIINKGDDHPGIGMLRHIDSSCKGQKSFAVSLLVLAMEIGRMDLSCSGSKKFGDSLHAMAVLWGYILANAATGGINGTGIGLVDERAGGVSVPSV